MKRFPPHARPLGAALGSLVVAGSAAFSLAALTLTALSLAPLTLAALSLAALPLPASAASTATAAAAADPSMEALLARHVEWLGGRSALDGLVTLSVAGRLEASGLAGTLRAVQHRDGRQRVDYDLGVVRGAKGIGRDSAWVADGSGRVEPMGAEEERVTRRGAARTFGAHLLAGDGSTRQDLGVEEREGRAWRVVRFAYPDGDAHDLFLDPSDGSCTWVREHHDTGSSWSHLEDWRIVEGLRFPFRTAELRANPAANQAVLLDSVTVNGTVDDAAFEPPRAARKLHRIDPAASAWSPMTLYRGSYIFAAGAVNGTPVELLLDSGAGMTVLDRSFADSLGIATAGEVVARGTVGESSASFAKGLTVRIGPLELMDVTAAVIDLSGIAARLGRPLPVILGKEVFHTLVVDVDYPGERIRFHEPEGFRYEGPGRRLPVHAAEGGHKQIEISVEELPPALVGLDTGAGAALDLFGPYVEEHRLLEGRAPVSQGLTGGVGGMASQTLASLKRVEIAGYLLRDVPIGIPQTEKGAFATKRVAGNLGTGILKRFHVYFDYAHDCLWLEADPQSIAAPFERNRSGLILDRKDGALEVLLVAPGSPAEAAGWKAGERIAAVDGVPVGDRYLEAVDRFGTGEEGRTVRLTLEGGGDRSLTLRRYY